MRFLDNLGIITGVITKFTFNREFGTVRLTKIGFYVTGTTFNQISYYIIIANDILVFFLLYLN